MATLKQPKNEEKEQVENDKIKGTQRKEKWNGKIEGKKICLLAIERFFRMQLKSEGANSRGRNRAVFSKFLKASETYVRRVYFTTKLLLVSEGFRESS